MTNKSGILRQKCRLGKVDFDDDGECEEDLTIGIGFRCSNGVLLAGDRLRTTRNDVLKFVTKVRGFSPRKGLYGAMVGAGSSGYLDAVCERFNGRLKAGMTVGKARSAIDEACKQMYETYMKSGDGDEPHFSFLLALSCRKGGFQLFQGASGVPLSAVEDNYTSIGKGAALANCLVRTLYSWDVTCLDITCEEAACVSAGVIRLVKRYVSGCGGGTNIIAVMPEGLVRPESVRARKEVEEHFLKFFKPVRVDLQKFIRRECQNPLLVRRFPREEKTGRGSQS